MTSEHEAAVVAPPFDAEGLQTRLGLRFRDTSRFRAAFVHESYVHENPAEASNERLEFLGDAVLGLAVSEMLYARFPSHPEGELTRMRAMLVSRPSLANHARELGLGASLLLSRGGQTNGERDRASILANVFEAVIGALFLDSGWEAARDFVQARFHDALEPLPETDRNYKSLLQQLTQKHFKALPEYRVVREKGPPHAKVFQVEVYFRNELLGRGHGKSKKEAQQEAARIGLDRATALLAHLGLTAEPDGQGSASTP